MSPENTREVFDSLGISVICGSVITMHTFPDTWQKIRVNNDTALRLREQYGGVSGGIHRGDPTDARFGRSADR